MGLQYLFLGQSELDWLGDRAGHVESCRPVDLDHIFLRIITIDRDGVTVGADAVNGNISLLEKPIKILKLF